MTFSPTRGEVFVLGRGESRLTGLMCSHSGISVQTSYRADRDLIQKYCTSEKALPLTKDVDIIFAAPEDRDSVKEVVETVLNPNAE